MSYLLVDRVPNPHCTLTGKTGGPAIALGLARRPGPLYMHVQSELRQAVHAAGWPLPEEHLKTLAEVDELRDLLADANERLDELAAENDTLRGAVSIVRKRKPTTDAAPAAA